MHKVVAFDLDATLIDEKNRIIGGQKTIDQLRALHNKGFQLVINTGRLDHDIDYICEKYKLPIDGRISQNGAVIYHDNVLRASLLDKEEALEFYKIVRNYSIRVEMNTVSNRYWHNDRDPDFPKEFFDSSHIISDFTPIILNQPVVLFLLIGDKEEISQVRNLVKDKFSNLEAVRTSPTSLEVLAKGVSKGKALISLYDDIHLYAIGDSENDYSMFDVAKKSYLISDDVYEDAEQIEAIDLALDDILEIVDKGR